MSNADLIDKNGKKVSELKLSSEIFSAPVREDILHSYCVSFLRNRRHGNASTKDRSEVSGGGKKPWRQKGTGRARHGSIRSPIWKGGGVTFGPKPRDYHYKLSKKTKRMALRSALSVKFLENKIKFVDELKLDMPKTKEFIKILDNLKIKDKVLIVSERKDEVLEKSTSNLSKVKILQVSNLTAYDILAFENLIITKDSLKYLEGTLR